MRTEHERAPLLGWLERHAEESNETIAAGLKISPKPVAESIRQIAHVYRPVSWDLCFALEEYTKRRDPHDWVDAHALRHQKPRRRKKAA